MCGTYLSFEQDAKPISGISASPRTACVCPENVLTDLCVCHSRIVLSALPARYAFHKSGRCARWQGSPVKYLSASTKSTAQTD